MDRQIKDIVELLTQASSKLDRLEDCVSNYLAYTQADATEDDLVFSDANEDVKTAIIVLNKELDRISKYNEHF